MISWLDPRGKFGEHPAIRKIELEHVPPLASRRRGILPVIIVHLRPTRRPVAEWSQDLCRVRSEDGALRSTRPQLPALLDQ